MIVSIGRYAACVSWWIRSGDARRLAETPDRRSTFMRSVNSAAALVTVGSSGRSFSISSEGGGGDGTGASVTRSSTAVAGLPSLRVTATFPTTVPARGANATAPEPVWTRRRDSPGSTTSPAGLTATSPLPGGRIGINNDDGGLIWTSGGSCRGHNVGSHTPPGNVLRVSPMGADAEGSWSRLAQERTHLRLSAQAPANGILFFRHKAFRVSAATLKR